MKSIDLKGKIVEKDSYPYLSIIWHKSKWGTYCHSAVLRFANNAVEDLSVIEVICKITVLDKKKPVRFYYQPTATYLPVKVNEGVVSVPLNCSNLIDAISMNNWTLNKKKQRNRLIGRATGFKWTYAGNEYQYDFLPDNAYSPAMLCEPYLKDLREGEKLEIRICFNPIIFKDNLFDL